MACSKFFLCLFLSLSSIFLSASSLSSHDEKKVYIVYLGDKSHADYVTESLHRSLLDNILETGSVEESLIYSYGRSFNGFAARLTHKEKQNLAGMEGVVSVFLSRSLKLQTTRSWDFLGFSQTAKRNLAVERDVVIGFVDTGIWPESKSFSDDGFGPPPSRWKGVCQNFTCNNKIIGARFYGGGGGGGGELSPRDDNGHGTHTASTAAGNAVAGASLLGLGGGTARGAVPGARIAAYKVCWADGYCSESDVLAAFDDAIADGVDVLSVSLGLDEAVDYFDDAIAIGAFHAMRRGVVTAVAAGNAGPDAGSVSSVAPWMLSVGASTIDRLFSTELVLGNNRTIPGPALNTFPTMEKLYPFVDILECGTIEGVNPTDEAAMKGNIALCGYPGSAPYEYGARGMVNSVDYGGHMDVAKAYTLPSITVNVSVWNDLKSYISGTSKPAAKIQRTEAIFDREAPVVASFSSRGPNRITPGILKPDIVAPGINILAAWPADVLFTTDYDDGRRSLFNIISGTSMACPHAAGAAAYVKSFHPRWSPAAIQSALITTATPMRPTSDQDAELAYGAGQLNPVRARNPGLVYDAGEADYIRLLCAQYNSTQITLITGAKTDCPKNSKHWSSTQLNYPTMALSAKNGAQFRAEFTRTVTNVGRAQSTYVARIRRGQYPMSVTVNPRVLSFARIDEKKSFVVTVSGIGPPTSASASAAVVWSDGKHHVRSPINVHSISA